MVDPLHPYCQVCGWRKGGRDSWDGTRCKCGSIAPPIDAVLDLPAQVKITEPQAKALRAIAEENSGPSSVGVLEIWRLPGRMVDSYRVAGSLIDKGLVTRTGDYLYITDTGRRALATHNAGVQP